MTQAQSFFDKHGALLADARQHLHARDCWNAYPEMPSEKLFGDGAAAEGRRRFEALLNASFDLPAHPEDRRGGGEQSPYGLELNIRYPQAAADKLLDASVNAMPGWNALSVDERAGVLLEAMRRLSADSFLMAHAVMHTTGQGFFMAFQAGAAHALERALEAMTAAHALLQQTPASVVWEKPQGKRPPLRLQKTYRAMPRGVGLVVACSTFPTWNSYPAIFANLLCGNAVLVKPHPETILPLALTVRVLREVLHEAGVDANLVCLAVDSAEQPLAATLATDARVKLVDYTGGSAFGDWLEANAKQAHVFTEKSGANCLLIDSFADVAGMAANIAFSLSLYSGQMCTTPQNLFIPRRRHGELRDALDAALQKLLADDAKAVEVLGALQSPRTLQRQEDAARQGTVDIAARAPSHPEFPQARIRTPLVVSTEDAELWRQECFGPVAFLIPTDTTEDAMKKMRQCLQTPGALTAAVYTDDATVAAAAEDMCAAAGVNAAFNLVGVPLVNHSTAFSDLHGTGANAAANAVLTDAAFVASRFYWAQTRRPA